MTDKISCEAHPHSSWHEAPSRALASRPAPRACRRGQRPSRRRVTGQIAQFEIEPLRQYRNSAVNSAVFPAWTPATTRRHRRDECRKQRPARIGLLTIIIAEKGGCDPGLPSESPRQPPLNPKPSPARSPWLDPNLPYYALYTDNTERNSKIAGLFTNTRGPPHSLTGGRP